MTSEAEQRLLHPAPGSVIEAAQKFGIDLTLLVERLRMTPTERLRALQRAMSMVAQIRGAARTAQRTHD
ncbi:MAG: hypothetical protein A3F84_19415 [Candidatus Handelsmanbacteria bacterium RIFCSPLOWO2_12_FULL_64_10]|uniref:Uncharacterized protein n=1 Tax=Handelsmanbacteria sp. (strain RIFCSPLOWO2_12_FULL_64_10) TaxID=1817868 RepID=A0A1F6CSL9_HANXR|nr:MAG: hypothetical protein A3F84_19415 [Candidatus Handelsmanbacteria bacterium RIFCSPLOWO2_12_FULL_64_10]